MNCTVWWRPSSCSRHTELISAGRSCPGLGFHTPTSPPPLVSATEKEPRNTKNHHLKPGVEGKMKNYDQKRAKVTMSAADEHTLWNPW